jgi:magnesium-dependent phosphatase 1
MFNDVDNLPQVIVFDLDDTLWTGDVDCTGGPPFKRDKNSRHTVYCSRRRPVKLFEDVPQIFDDLVDDNIRIAYASRTWEPEWAKAALSEFSCGQSRVVDMWSVAAGHGWGDVSKVSHLSEISKQLSLPISSMVFIDNEMRNIRDITKLGATCGYCPDGLTKDIFKEALIRHSDTVRKL